MTLMEEADVSQDKVSDIDNNKHLNDKEHWNDNRNAYNLDNNPPD